MRELQLSFSLMRGDGLPQRFFNFFNTRSCGMVGVLLKFQTMGPSQRGTEVSDTLLNVSC